MRRIGLRRGMATIMATGAIGVLCAGSALAFRTPGRPALAPTWLTFNATSHTAYLTLVPNYNYVDWGYNFDGYSRGHMVITVPLGWRVKVLCSVSAHATVTHSCAITSSITADDAAFPHSKIPNAVNGLPPGDSAAFTFTASRVGTYAIECLVPGHDDATMWDVFTVNTAALPSIAFK